MGPKIHPVYKKINKRFRFGFRSVKTRIVLLLIACEPPLNILADKTSKKVTLEE